MKVLIPLDDPELSAEILNFVVQQNFPADVSFFLLHVIAWQPDEIALAVSSEVRIFLERETAKAEVLLADAMEHLARSYKLANFERSIQKGMPVEEILAVAEDWQADLIVMASHNRKGTRSFFLGSVAKSVGSRCRCSIALVRERELVAQSQESSIDSRPIAL